MTTIDEDVPRDYLDEAIKMMTGQTKRLPELQHLLALREYYQERLERERTRRQEPAPVRRVL